MDLRRYLPHAFVATLVVAITPLFLIARLQSGGYLDRSPLFAAAAALALSTGLGAIGSWYWMRRPGSRDVVFADLMLWGWVRRYVTERKVLWAARKLGLDRRGRRTADVTIGRERQTALLRSLASALEARDPYTHGHTKRVARHAYRIARTMGISGDDAALIRTAAAVHDVGKIRVPQDILTKPGALSVEEYEVMKTHPSVGADMVEAIGDPDITEIVRHHHERIDGLGYPHGLAGEAIPIGARIVAVADTFDAITSTRAYRPASKHKDAVETIKRASGTQLDPDAVKAFLTYYSGRNSVAWWALVSTLPQRFYGWIGGLLQKSGLANIVNGVAAAGAAAVIAGGSVMGAAVLGPRAEAQASPQTVESPVVAPESLNVVDPSFRSRTELEALREKALPGTQDAGVGDGSDAAVADGADATTEMPADDGSTTQPPDANDGGNGGGGLISGTALEPVVDDVLDEPVLHPVVDCSGTGQVLDPITGDCS